MKVTEYFDNFVTSVLNKVHAAKLSIYIGKARHHYRSLIYGS